MSANPATNNNDTDTEPTGIARPIPESWARHGHHEPLNEDGEVRMYAATVRWLPAHEHHFSGRTPLGEGRFVKDGVLHIEYIDPTTGQECWSEETAVYDTHTDTVVPYAYWATGPEGFRASITMEPDRHESTYCRLKHAQHVRDIYDLADENGEDP